MGCQAHGLTRQQAKNDYCVYWTVIHCWCGFDLRRTQGMWHTPLDDQRFEVSERATCSLDKHFKQYNSCGSTSRYDGKTFQSSPCGLHGLNYHHCILCLEPLDGELVGTLNGNKVYRPFNIADRILRLLKLK